MRLFSGAGGKKGGKKGSVNGKKDDESDIFKLVKMIMQRNFDPVCSAPPPNESREPSEGS